jgi:polygalacturonase
MNKIVSVFLVIVIAVSAGAQSYFDVTRYGAKKDSSANAASAIAKAIAAAVKGGGGTVYFPPGKYLTGAIHLKSNITILIDAGAEIHFSDNFDDYLPMVESRYEGVDVKSFSPLFYAYKAENIAITGRGLINGHGKKWWDFVEGYRNDQPRSRWQFMFDSLNKNILLPDDPRQMKRGFLRPPFIQPMYCKNVLIEGITIINSPFWTVNPEFCENVTITGVTINNPPSPNTDGINPESCRYVHISNCHISVGDDCITIKSGKDVPGRTKAMPAQNYTITNCTMLSGHGGVVIGSEMSGGIKNIVISNCIFDGTDRGIRIKTTRGRGGIVEDIRVDNIIMKNIRDQAFVMDMEYSKTDKEPVSERTPQIRNVRISNVTAYTNQAAFINGLEEMPVENVSFNDIYMEASTGFVIRKARNIELHNVTINVQKGSAIEVGNSSEIEIDAVKTTTPLANTAVISMLDTESAYIRNCRPVLGTALFISLKGGKTNNILIKGNSFDLVKKAIEQSAEVKGVVKVEDWLIG